MDLRWKYCAHITPHITNIRILIYTRLCGLLVPYLLLVVVYAFVLINIGRRQNCCYFGHFHTNYSNIGIRFEMLFLDTRRTFSQIHTRNRSIENLMHFCTWSTRQHTTNCVLYYCCSHLLMSLTLCVLLRMLMIVVPVIACCCSVCIFYCSFIYRLCFSAIWKRWSKQNFAGFFRNFQNAMNHPTVWHQSRIQYQYFNHVCHTTDAIKIGRKSSNVENDLMVNYWISLGEWHSYHLLHLSLTGTELVWLRLLLFSLDDVDVDVHTNPNDLFTLPFGGQVLSREL